MFNFNRVIDATIIGCGSIGNRNFYFIYVLWLIFLLCFVKQFDGNINKVTTIVKAIACAHSLILVIGFSLIYQSSVNRIENVEEQLKMVSVIKVLY